MGRKLTIKEMKNLAQSRGGECLSDQYIDAETKLLWKCGNGHVFEATPHYIKKGHWCSKCAWENKLKELIEIAKNKGGECLTDKYISSIAKMRWKCEFGHLFEASPYEIKKGAWCSKCRQLEISKIKIEESKELASRKGGRCLTKEYINNRTKMKWECSEGHIWEASFHVIKRGHWCPVCAKNKTLTIEDMQEIARQRGGKCLSKEYVNSSTKLLWECEFGHTWEATPGNVKRRKSWCPYCSNKFSSEEICRYVFESLFNKKFPKIRPSWLVNEQGNRLELDGYSEELQLAFEHQGGQHYKKIDFFERHMALERKQENDNLKKKICGERGINIIYIDQLGEKTQIEELKEHIIDQCKILGLDEYVQKICDVNIDYPKAYSSYSKQMLDKLREIAISKGGECLSDRYINNNSPMKWKCFKGHIWESAPVNIKNMGHWCPICSGNQRISMVEIQQLAIARGGKCLSKSYKNKDTKLMWQCSEGHIWEANLRNVRGNGTWCPHCYKIKRSKKSK